ncbi:hypothetical protein GCM10010423_69540 [Streptomyces levis]|uniref:Uncharacterized protein n=1 Tax=Streptomyces levis TaxID=285566 RepID=A0ABP6BJ88_9ACTN
MVSSPSSEHPRVGGEDLMALMTGSPTVVLPADAGVFGGEIGDRDAGWDADDEYEWVRWNTARCLGGSCQAPRPGACSSSLGSSGPGSAGGAGAARRRRRAG